MTVGREFWRSKVENKTASLTAVIVGIVLSLDNLFFSASFLVQLSNPCRIYYCSILPSSLYLQYYLNCRSQRGSILIVLAFVSTNSKGVLWKIRARNIIHVFLMLFPIQKNILNPISSPQLINFLCRHLFLDGASNEEKSSPMIKEQGSWTAGNH